MPQVRISNHRTDNLREARLSDLVEESAADRVALGGCEVFPEAPDRLCQNCGHDRREDAPAS